jgi:hypothetical protein
MHISSSFNWQNGFDRHFENRSGDYRVIITSMATNQRGEFSMITYVIILIHYNHTIIHWGIYQTHLYTINPIKTQESSLEKKSSGIRQSKISKNLNIFSLNVLNFVLKCANSFWSSKVHNVIHKPVGKLRIWLQGYYVSSSQSDVLFTNLLMNFIMNFWTSQQSCKVRNIPVKVIWNQQ